MPALTVTLGMDIPTLHDKNWVDVEKVTDAMYRGRATDGRKVATVLLQRKFKDARDLSSDDLALLENIKSAKKAGQKIVYFSLGTLVSHTKEFYETVMEDFRDHPEVTLVFALGVSSDHWRPFESMEEVKKFKFNTEVPKNVILTNNAPQFRVLELADAFITHCGAGSILEAMHFAVPLIAIPCEDDQLPNAARMVKNGLALSLHEFGQCGPSKISLLKEMSMPKKVIREAVDKMLANLGTYKTAALAQQKLIESAMGPEGAAQEVIKAAELRPTTGGGDFVKSPIPF